MIGFNLCEKIYSLEKELRKNHGEKLDLFEIRYKERLKYVATILKYVAAEIEDALPKSPLGKVLDYSKKLLTIMKTILEDGSLEVDNNAAERAIKIFVIGRKNWLFANTGKGRISKSNIYSIIETAKSYGLSV